MGARLPIPGEDEGTWGEILNKYLEAAHKADGSLKDNSVTAATLANGAVQTSGIGNGTVTGVKLADDTISEAKLDPAVRSLLHGSGASVTSVAGKTGTVTLARSDVGLDNVDNTADSAKPISTATQNALDAKANASSLAAVATTGAYSDLSGVPSNFTPSVHTHSTADVTNGTLDIARIPTGASGTTVALGNHTHSNYLPVKNGTSTLSDPTNDKLARIEIMDDGSNTANWPDRMEFFFDPAGVTPARRTSYFNEYGELRISPAKGSTVPLRLFQRETISDPAHNAGVALFEIMDNRSDRNIIYQIHNDGSINTTGGGTFAGGVTATNIKNKVVCWPTGSEPNFASQPDGTLWIEYTP